MNAVAREALRFSVHGSRGFERWLAGRLARIADDVRAAVGRNLVALVLGGGYGRGEGAVVGPRGCQRPYNDLDLLVVVHRPLGVARRLDEVSARHRELVGIDVDFGRPLTVPEIERWEPRLRWYDLVHGHVVLSGDPDLLARHAPRRVSAPVPIAEAARLLLNRGAGILSAMLVTRGGEEPPDDDFVRRNIYKAFLAVGDSYIIRAQQRTTRHVGRPALLASLAHRLPSRLADEIVARYAQAVSFKLAPDSLPRGPAATGLLDAAAGLWSRALLDVENERHGTAFSTPDEYARWPGLREPQPASRWLWNLIGNLRHGLLSPWSPREALYREVPRLIAAGHGPAWVAASRDALALWRRVND